MILSPKITMRRRRTPWRLHLPKSLFLPHLQPLKTISKQRTLILNQQRHSNLYKPRTVKELSKSKHRERKPRTEMEATWTEAMMVGTMAAAAITIEVVETNAMDATIDATTKSEAI